MRIQSYNPSGMLITAACLLSMAPNPAEALSVPNLHVYAGGLVHNYALVGSLQIPASGNFQTEDNGTGPINASATSGTGFTYYHPTYDALLDTTLYTRERARADYGTNHAFVEANLSARDGSDCTIYPCGDLINTNAVLRVETGAESAWNDTFVVTGGTGLGTGSVSVALHGHAETRYGANGTVWYDEPMFEAFGSSGFGNASYTLQIWYDAPPTGAPPEYGYGEYSHPITWQQDYVPPVPAYVTEVGPVPPELLTGSFLFEYDVPFSLVSTLAIAGYNQINIDFDHTATLSGFDLPGGATLTSGSGHLYTISSVPLPAALWLFGSALLGTGGWLSRKALSARDTLPA